MNHLYMSKPEPGSNFLLIIVSCLFFTLSCKETDDNDPVIPTFPPLSDVIPYDKLGQGKLVFQRIGPMDNAYSGIYVLDIQQQMSWGISDGDLDGPAVSPDGQKIAFTTYTSDETAYDVYVMGIDGAYRERVSNIRGQEHIPCWTPDGSQIYYTIKTDHTDLTQITSAAGITDRSLSWSE